MSSKTVLLVSSLLVLGVASVQGQDFKLVVDPFDKFLRGPGDKIDRYRAETNFERGINLHKTVREQIIPSPPYLGGQHNLSSGLEEAILACKDLPSFLAQRIEELDCHEYELEPEQSSIKSLKRTSFHVDHRCSFCGGRSHSTVELDLYPLSSAVVASAIQSALREADAGRSSFKKQYGFYFKNNWNINEMVSVTCGGKLIFGADHNGEFKKDAPTDGTKLGWMFEGLAREGGLVNFPELECSVVSGGPKVTLKGDLIFLHQQRFPSQFFRFNSLLTNEQSKLWQMSGKVTQATHEKDSFNPSSSRYNTTVEITSESDQIPALTFALKKTTAQLSAKSGFISSLLDNPKLRTQLSTYTSWSDELFKKTLALKAKMGQNPNMAPALDIDFTKEKGSDHVSLVFNVKDEFIAAMMH